MPDPEEPCTRYHTYILVQNHPVQVENPESDPRLSSDGETYGWVHEVTGDIASPQGMIYLHRPVTCAPQLSETFHTVEFLGQVLAAGYPDNVDRICRAEPPPPCQKKFNACTMRYEAINAGDGAGAGRYFKCTEWTEERVIPALYREGVLVKGGYS